MRTVRMGTWACALLIAVVFTTQAAKADEIVMKNGDHITGAIETADGAKITIKTDMIGEITVDMANVKTFSTDEPIKLQLNDGTVVDQKVAQGNDGEVNTVAGGALAAQAIPLSKVAKINPPPIKWTGQIAINGLLAQGNTSSEQLGLSADAVRRTDDDRITLGAAYLYGRQTVNGIESTTENNWFVAGKYDYFFTTKLYGYGNIRVEQDHVANLTLRMTPGLGLGYQWFEKPDFKFNTEAGLSWVYEDYSTQPTPNEYTAVRLAYHLIKSFDNDKFSVFNNVQYFPSIQDENQYLVIGDAGVHVGLTKTMFSEFKVEATYDNVPAPGTKRTNVKYILGVGWTF